VRHGYEPNDGWGDDRLYGVKQLSAQLLFAGDCPDCFSHGGSETIATFRDRFRCRILYRRDCWAMGSSSPGAFSRFVSQGCSLHTEPRIPDLVSFDVHTAEAAPFVELYQQSQLQR
jgi:hypothetical protein